MGKNIVLLVIALVVIAGIILIVRGRGNKATNSATPTAEVTLEPTLEASATSTKSATIMPSMAPTATASARATATPKATASAAASTSNTKIEISNFAFSPANLTVKAGTKITVTNLDAAGHSITSDDAKSFDTGILGQNKSGSFTAPTKAGTYSFHCSVHPSMTGKLIVQ